MLREPYQLLGPWIFGDLRKQVSLIQLKKENALNTIQEEREKILIDRNDIPPKEYAINPWEISWKKIAKKRGKMLKAIVPIKSCMIILLYYRNYFFLKLSKLIIFPSSDDILLLSSLSDFSMNGMHVISYVPVKSRFQYWYWIKIITS